MNRYNALRAADRCVDCRARAFGFARCEECRVIADRSSRRWQGLNRPRRAAIQAAYRKARPGQYAGYMRRFRADRRANGLCSECNDPRAPHAGKCERHLARDRKAHR